MSQLSRTRKRLAMLEKRQERLMPYAENKHLAKQVAIVAERCRWLHAEALYEMSEVVAHHIHAQDSKLKKQNSHMIDVAVSRLAGTSPAIEHCLKQQIRYFQDHGDISLANNAVDEINADKHFIAETGLSLAHVDECLELGCYSKALYWYKRGKHLLSLARQIRKGY